MKTKSCALCKIDETTLFRIQIKNEKTWIFVCKLCCTKSKTLEHYKYGGTWKGSKP